MLEDLAILLLWLFRGGIELLDLLGDGPNLALNFLLNQISDFFLSLLCEELFLLLLFLRLLCFVLLLFWLLLRIRFALGGRPLLHQVVLNDHFFLIYIADNYFRLLNFFLGLNNFQLVTQLQELTLLEI